MTEEKLRIWWCTHRDLMWPVVGWASEVALLPGAETAPVKTWLPEGASPQATHRLVDRVGAVAERAAKEFLVNGAGELIVTQNARCGTFEILLGEQTRWRDVACFTRVGRLFYSMLHAATDLPHEFDLHYATVPSALPETRTTGLSLSAYQTQKLAAVCALHLGVLATPGAEDDVLATPVVKTLLRTAGIPAFDFAHSVLPRLVSNLTTYRKASGTSGTGIVPVFSVWTRWLAHAFEVYEGAGGERRMTWLQSSAASSPPTGNLTPPPSPLRLRLDAETFVV